MTAKRALIVLTSHADLGNTGKTTGYYLVEVAAPYYAFQEVGLAIDFASPRGGPARPWRFATSAPKTMP